jgi:hypothetical protein
MTTTLDHLQCSLIRKVKKPLKIILNKNSSTFIKIQFKTPIIASLHEAFLEAPMPIVGSLASFISGNKSEEERLYEYMVRYLKRKPPETLGDSKGSTYDLASLFQYLNKKYFSDSLSLKTTWWKKRRVSRSSCALGVFVDALQLIKIDSLLDTSHVPQYVVEGILHHEMLHAVILPKKDSIGRIIVHTPEFRKQEQAFPKFLATETWLRNNRSLFF